LDRLNTHQCSYVTRADRRVEGWLRRNGWAEGWAGGGMGLRVGFININDMYNNDVGKGGVRVYEAYEVK
jgi:hypothetical protein